MEHPEEDVIAVIHKLTTTPSPDVQERTIRTYMTHDVSFEHPVCSVRSGHRSREKLLKIFQWYRVLSPRIDLKVESVVYDQENQVLYVEVVQWFKLFFLPFSPRPARLLTRLELRRSQNLYYISRQEDFYHTYDFAKLVFPPLAPLIYILLTLGTIVSCIGAMGAQAFGIWVPTKPQDMPEDEHDYAGDNEGLYAEGTRDER